LKLATSELYKSFDASTLNEVTDIELVSFNAAMLDVAAKRLGGIACGGAGAA
jgi:hypothetical protein